MGLHLTLPTEARRHGTVAMTATLALLHLKKAKISRLSESQLLASILMDYSLLHLKVGFSTQSH
jgi:hypothetical protein